MVFPQLFYKHMSQIANHNPLTGPQWSGAKPRSWGRRWRSMRGAVVKFGASWGPGGIPEWSWMSPNKWVAKCRKAQKKHWILSCFNDSLKMAVGTTCGQDSNSNGDAKRGCSLISTIGVVDISPVMIFFFTGWLRFHHWTHVSVGIHENIYQDWLLLARIKIHHWFWIPKIHKDSSFWMMW